MGRTYEGLFKETVEVALKNKLDVAFNTLVNLNLSCVAVSADSPLADIKPGDDVFKKDYRFTVKEKSRFVSCGILAGTTGAFFDERNVCLHCGLEIRCFFCGLFHLLTRRLTGWIVPSSERGALQQSSGTLSRRAMLLLREELPPVMSGET